MYGQSNLLNFMSNGNVNSEKKTPIIFKEINSMEDVNVEYGDVFQLGCHRLMCGDSRSVDDINVLMNGSRADITFTSPPYNTGGGGGYRFDKNLGRRYFKDDEQFYNLIRDDLSDEDYGMFLTDTCKHALEYSDNVLYNIGILKGSKKGLCVFLYNLKDYFCDILLWDKGNKSMPMGLPSQCHMVNHDGELVFCFNKEGNRNFHHSQWKGGNMSNVIRTHKKSRNEFSKYHKATFPLEFAKFIVKEFSEDSVLDLFGGTGTTLIACEELNRKCFMMELDPLYCQIIINRYEGFSGEEAVKL